METVVEILSIFSFSIILFFINCANTLWYTQLPKIKIENSDFKIGIYSKKKYFRSPMNSKIFSNTISEELIFFEDGIFKKTIEEEERIENNKKITKKNAYGKYLVNGNWLLLCYPHQISEQIENGVEKRNNNLLKLKEYKLLYYYEKKNKFIIPMVNDRGFEMINYGVKDHVKNPYIEDDPNFLIALKLFSVKEYQSHAYYYRDNK